ncbi:hypothetical protein [Paenarthrobacter sp. PH39-S1]|uniref:hypothetical protein n=1 Tax=Paenarthrobacter sp. PH39-S1 TaxID=3046204 RepID=UPI0024B9FF5A|nr:hypothetical protein [Paenarthrobacter sp. PH39-S1]MDJ0358537.1 hypothetical protein [Paenarthrobacter sp. PH39-S1]
MTQYLDIEDATQVIDGYRFHVRDIGRLASALARPATTVMGADAYPGLSLKIAALLESVARFTR